MNHLFNCIIIHPSDDSSSKDPHLSSNTDFLIQNTNTSQQNLKMFSQVGIIKNIRFIKEGIEIWEVR